jgi:hypothetical protein
MVTSPVISCSESSAPFVPAALDLVGGRCQLSAVELVGAAKAEGQVAQGRANFAFRIDQCSNDPGSRTTFLKFLLTGDPIQEQHDDDDMTKVGDHKWQSDGYKGDVFDTRQLCPGTAFSASVFTHSQFGGKMGSAPALVLTGKRVAEWVDVKADRSAKRIEVQVAVKISELDGSLGSLFQFVRQKIVAGIGRFWSRSITLQDGSTWQVVTTAVESTIGVEFQCMKQLWSGQRACNTGVVVNGMPVIFPYNPSESDDSAMDTAAHEFGHSVLRGAVSDDFSLHHKGTSTGWQNPAPNAPACPATGEIDLMMYFKDSTYPAAQSYYPRLIAAQEDVKRLVSLGAVVIGKQG